MSSYTDMDTGNVHTAPPLNEAVDNAIARLQNDVCLLNTCSPDFFPELRDAKAPRIKRFADCMEQAATSIRYVASLRETGEEASTSVRRDVLAAPVEPSRYSLGRLLSLANGGSPEDYDVGGNPRGSLTDLLQNRQPSHSPGLSSYGGDSTINRQLGLFLEEGKRCYQALTYGMGDDGHPVTRPLDVTWTIEDHYNIVSSWQAN